MSLYNRHLGLLGETEANSYLKKQGFQVIDKNFRCRWGEIDIVAKKNNTIFFIEVKTRSGFNMGRPYEAVDKRKFFHLRQAANYFILKNHLQTYKLNIGVISIIFNGQKASQIKFFTDIFI